MGLGFGSGMTKVGVMERLLNILRDPGKGIGDEGKPDIQAESTSISSENMKVGEGSGTVERAGK